MLIVSTYLYWLMIRSVRILVQWSISGHFGNFGGLAVLFALL